MTAWFTEMDKQNTQKFVHNARDFECDLPIILKDTGSLGRLLRKSAADQEFEDEEKIQFDFLLALI